MAAIASIQPASVAVTGGLRRRERRRWTAALVIAFALGFLLAWYLLHRTPLLATDPWPTTARRRREWVIREPTVPPIRQRRQARCSGRWRQQPTRIAFHHERGRRW